MTKYVLIFDVHLDGEYHLVDVEVEAKSVDEAQEKGRRLAISKVWSPDERHLGADATLLDWWAEASARP